MKRSSYGKHNINSTYRWTVARAIENGEQQTKTGDGKEPEPDQQQFELHKAASPTKLCHYCRCICIDSKLIWSHDLQKEVSIRITKTKSTHQHWKPDTMYGYRNHLRREWMPFQQKIEPIPDIYLVCHTNTNEHNELRCWHQSWSGPYRARDEDRRIAKRYDDDRRTGRRVETGSKVEPEKNHKKNMSNNDKKSNLSD